jgi:hypothetical protein
MIPQERGLERIHVYFLFYLPFGLRGRIHYVGFLGRAMRLFIPHELLKTAFGLMRGSVDLLFTPSFACSLVHSFHPHPHLDLEKGTELSNISHGIFGFSGRWCDPTTT